MILELIGETLNSGRPVVLRNVGTLECYMKRAQRYRHPITGKFHTAEPKKHVRFILSARLREVMRAG